MADPAITGSLCEDCKSPATAVVSDHGRLFAQLEFEASCDTTRSIKFEVIPRGGENRTSVEKLLLISGTGGEE